MYIVYKVQFRTFSFYSSTSFEYVYERNYFNFDFYKNLIKKKKKKKKKEMHKSFLNTLKNYLNIVFDRTFETFHTYISHKNT